MTRHGQACARAAVLLVDIYAALQILLPIPARANEWIRKPNTAPFLAGHSALARMLGGHVADLFVVSQYLDSGRGGKACFVARESEPWPAAFSPIPRD